MAKPDPRPSRPLPLHQWRARMAADRAARAHLRRRIRFTATGGLAGLVLASALLPPAPRLIWNVSESAPRGLYVVTPRAPLAPGDMVAARVPEPWRSFAARRHYLPANVPLVKRVVAAEGDIVCAHGEHISINALPAVTRRARDGARAARRSGSCAHWSCARVGVSTPDLRSLG